MVTIHTIMSTASAYLGRVIGRERVDSWVKTLLGAKPCVLTGMVAEVGAVFLWVRASIWESCRQKAHKTLVEARFALQKEKIDVRGTLLEDEVGKMRTRQ